MQQTNTELVSLVEHRYNSHSVDIGDSVVVDIGRKYVAIVEGLKLDLKNKKIFAYLKTFGAGCPIRVDVSDCRKLKNDI